MLASPKADRPATGRRKAARRSEGDSLVSAEMTGARRWLGIVVAVAALTAGSLLGVSAASADSPENFPLGGPPFVTVSPSSNLTDGQMVAVSGTGFPASSVIVLSQCAVAPPIPESPQQVVCSTIVGPEIRTDASGNFGPINIPVSEVVLQDSPSGLRALSCGPPTSDCTIDADIGEPGGGVGARHLLFFGTQGPAPTTTIQPGGATTTIQPGGATTTIQPGGATTTIQPGGATTTIQPGGATTTVAAGGATTTVCPAAACPVTTVCPTPCPGHQTTTVRAPAALVRTGSGTDVTIAWAAMALTVGGLLFIGATGVPGAAAPTKHGAGNPPLAGRRRRRRR